MSGVLRVILVAVVAAGFVCDSALARGGFGGGAHFGGAHIGVAHIGGGFPGAFRPGFPGALRPGLPYRGFYGYRRFGPHFAGPLVIGSPYYGYYGYAGPSCVWARLLVPTRYGLRYGLVPICF